MSESFEEYDIGEEMKEKLSAEKIKDLGMQVFKSDESNILKYFHHFNKGRTQFANHVEDSNEDQNILEGIIETDNWKELIYYDIQGSEIKKPEVDKFRNMSRLRINAEFDKYFLKNDVNAVDFDITIKRMASILLAVIKETCVEKIKKHAKAPTVNLEGGKWIESNDSIGNDLYHIISAFEDQKQGKFSLTNFVTSRRALTAVRKYYRTVEGSFNQNDMFPDDSIKRSMEVFPQLERGLIGIDVTKKPCKLFYNVDPRYNTGNKTEEQSFINVIIDDTNMEGGLPHKLIVQMFVEFSFGINPYALLYQPDV